MGGGSATVPAERWCWRSKYALIVWLFQHVAQHSEDSRSFQDVTVQLYVLSGLYNAAKRAGLYTPWTRKFFKRSAGNTIFT